MVLNPAEWEEAPPPVLSIGEWRSNAELIADCARLGYLRKEWLTLDPTYGYGAFWTEWRPDHLVGSDIDPKKSPSEPQDFTRMVWEDLAFEAVVFDPPYKLNGTPTEAVDERAGVHIPTRWQDRMGLIKRGTVECARVCSGYLLVKCQDQVCSGKMRWQTDLVTKAATGAGFGKVDRFDFIAGRPQPEGRSQKHARHYASQLLVFKRGW